MPRIFLYDAYPGGIGFSAPLFGMHAELLTRTRLLIAGCDCEHGCPTCVGPVGETGPLAKTVALRLLQRLLPLALGGAETDRLTAGELNRVDGLDATSATAAAADEVPF
jgi:ATP-dependent helicase YprA (DUF1998 family)